MYLLSERISPIFRLMRITGNRLLVFVLGLVAIAIFAPADASAQRSVYLDSDGNTISNNEFVDIRMANFHYPDATIVKTLADGTTEFRLQKIPQEGMRAPNFEVRSLDGQKITLSELAGKVVVLNFWFIGCPACEYERPNLNALKTKFERDPNVVFLAMSSDPASDIKRYLAKRPFDFIHIADAETSLRSFHFSGYPKNIVINKNGEMVYWRSTVHAWDKFESVIKQALAK